MRESKFQKDLINDLRDMFPGCIILKNDSSYIQGIPDLLVLNGDRWVALEVKASASSPIQTNQDYYVDVMHNMSFAAFIFPENREDVLNAVQSALRS